MDSNKKKIFFTLLMIGTFANMDKGMVGLTVKELISQYGWSASDAGLILSIFYVSFILVTLPGGWFVDRFGYRKFVIFSLSVLTLGSIGFGMAGSMAAGSLLMALVGMRLFTGFGHAGYTNGAPKIIADNFAQEERGAVQGKVVATAGVGAIVAYTVGSYIISFNWQYAYYALAAFFATCLAVFYFWVPEKQLTAEEQAMKAAMPKVSPIEAWKNRNTLVLAAALLLNNLAGVGFLNWLPSMWAKTFTVSDSMLSMVLIGYAITLIVSCASAPGIIRKWFPEREKIFMFICSVVSAVTLVAAVKAPSFAMSVVALYISNLFLMSAFAGIILLPYRMIPIRIIGSAFAVINIGAFVGGIGQGLLVGRLVDAAGGDYFPAFLAMAVCVVVAGLIPFLLGAPAIPTTNAKK